MVAILEPFLSSNKCYRWARWLRLPCFVNNVYMGGKIWLFWTKEIKFELISISDQVVSGWFSLGSCRVLSTFVYASCFQLNRLELWDFLRVQDPLGLSWYIGRDFNIICNDGEKNGGLLQASRAKADFNDCLHDCALVDLPFKGNRLFWCNGRLGGRRIWAHLDRVLVNLSFMNCFGNAKLMYFPRTSSNHAPMLLNSNRDIEMIVRSFHFLHM